MKLSSIGLLTISLISIILISGCIGQETITTTTTTKTIETPTTTTTQILAEYLTYDSPAYGIRIKYPKNWGGIEQYMGTIVAFSSPLENGTGVNDTFAENVNIALEVLPNKTITLEQYTESGLSSMKKFYTNFNLIESEDTFIRNMPSHKLVYTFKQGEYDIKIMQVYTIKSDKSYIITYTGEIKNFDKYLDIVNEMIKSFEVI